MCLTISCGGLKVKKLPRPQNPNATKLTKDKQVGIARDDVSGAARNGRSQYRVVISVAADAAAQVDWHDDFCDRPNQFRRFGSFLPGALELADEAFPKLLKNIVRRDHPVLPSTMFHLLTANSARDESGNQDVGVQYDSHETRSKTS
jgi:hypothetical protein